MPIALALVLSVAAGAAGAARFDLTRDASGYRVDASADLVADPGVVWDALTDYESLPRFVPGVRRVDVLERRDEAGGQRLILEHFGEFRFLFFSQRVAALLDVRHVEHRIVRALALPRQSADKAEYTLNSFEGTYSMLPIPGGVRLDYHARFAVDFYVPPLLGSLVFKHTIRSQFEAMLGEIGRRQTALAARRSKP